MSDVRRAEIPKPISILLDGLRLTAAIVVFIGHLTQRLFSTDWPDLTNFGIAAVGVFFVLSGFVIQYTRPRHPDVGDYARARLVRLWSVVVPALVFTAGADLISYTANPAVYAAWIHTAPQNAVYFVADALFLNQSWGHELAFGSNNPIWSLGYEAGYYALFGACVYLRGWRRALALLALIALKGPQLLVLLPVWLLGVGVCALVLRNKGLIPALALSLVCAALLWLSRKLDFDHMFRWVPGGLGSHGNVALLLGSGFLTSSLILAAQLTVRAWGPFALALERPVRWLAGSTFSIYLFHFPTLVLIQAVTRYPRSDVLAKGLVFVGVLGFCVVVSLFTERRKGLWDGPIRWLIGRVSALSPAGAVPAITEKT